MSTRTVDAGDGRVLAINEAGDPDGLAVFVHHGTPSAGILYAPWVEHAAADGIRLIGFDRAGYGGSTRLPGRAISAVAADVEAIADAFGLDRFATWGISGGGPHALACAALCGERSQRGRQPRRRRSVGRGGSGLARRHGRGERRGVRARARRRGVASSGDRPRPSRAMLERPGATARGARHAARRRRSRRAHERDRTVDARNERERAPRQAATAGSTTTSRSRPRGDSSPATIDATGADRPGRRRPVRPAVARRLAGSADPRCARRGSTTRRGI